MIRHIPPKSTRRWSGPYLGDYIGDLWKTYNIDLDRCEGLISLSQRMQSIEDTTEHTGISTPAMAFIRTNADCTDRYWALTADGLLKTDSHQPEFSTVPTDDWDTDALDSSPNLPLDWTLHGNDSRNDSGRNKMFVTTDCGDIAVLNDTGNNVWDGRWWRTTQSQLALKGDTDAPFHPIEYFPFRKISVIGDGNLIHTISRTSDTVNDTVTYARLVLPNSYIARHIFHTSNRTWILLYNKLGGDGAIAEWDGFSQSYNDIHTANGLIPVLGTSYKDTPLILNSKGFFLEFTGRGFVPMVRNGQTIALPMAEEPGNALAGSAGEGVTFRADPRGMVMGEDNLVYMNLGSPLNNSYRQNSGIWSLNPQTGRLYHKYSFGQWGDSVDYGQQINSPVSASGGGGLYWVPEAIQAATAPGRNLLAGHRTFTDATTPISGIFLEEAITSTTPTRGYFITQYIPSDDIKEFFDTIWIKFSRFISSSNSIIIKARGTQPLAQGNRFPIQDTITWTTTTTFTVTLAVADDALQVGDEVEVFSGTNSGYLSHITIITGNHGALQTITVDETMSTATGTATARFDRWKKLGTITSTTIKDKFVDIGISSSFVQFKIEMRGPATQMDIQELIIVSHNDLVIEK